MRGKQSLILSDITAIFAINILGVSLRAGLSAHTAQALGAGPVSAMIPNAGCLLRFLPPLSSTSPPDTRGRAYAHKAKKSLLLPLVISRNLSEVVNLSVEPLFLLAV